MSKTFSVLKDFIARLCWKSSIYINHFMLLVLLCIKFHNLKGLLQHIILTIQIFDSLNSTSQDISKSHWSNLNYFYCLLAFSRFHENLKSLTTFSNLVIKSSSNSKSSHTYDAWSKFQSSLSVHNFILFLKTFHNS